MGQLQGDTGYSPQTSSPWVHTSENSAVVDFHLEVMLEMACHPKRRYFGHKDVLLGLGKPSLKMGP